MHGAVLRWTGLALSVSLGLGVTGAWPVGQGAPHPGEARSTWTAVGWGRGCVHSSAHSRGGQATVPTSTPSCQGPKTRSKVNT